MFGRTVSHIRLKSRSLVVSNQPTPSLSGGYVDLGRVKLVEPTGKVHEFTAMEFPVFVYKKLRLGEAMELTMTVVTKGNDVRVALVHSAFQSSLWSVGKTCAVNRARSFVLSRSVRLAVMSSTTKTLMLSHISAMPAVVWLYFASQPLIYGLLMFFMPVVVLSVPMWNVRHYAKLGSLEGLMGSHNACS
ncbi:hypothetical protein F7U66_01335 [Vibrio parahaemolyticus]|nr:hypothetical protein [Vibrio parahaemolyticus]